jgi:type I restriction enzyme, S subunit
MNAERLLKHYGRIADAPGAIARLRRFVLDLAVRGKLVPQDPKDEPATELLKHLTKHHSENSPKANRTNKDKSTEPEHDIPSSWLWVRIGDHLELINGMAFKPIDWLEKGIRIVRIQNLNRLDAPFNYCDP